MALTREDIIKNDKLVSTLTEYGHRRNGKTYDSKEEAVDSFLEDYRALQANTISTAKFMNFVNNLNDDNEEDAKFKKDLGELYKVVDEEVDEVFGDTSFGQKAGAIYDYAKYAIIDPINLLGGVAGKAIGATAGRAAIKGLLNNAFKSKVVKGAATVAAAEAPITAGQEALLQQTEKDLGVKEEVDLGEIATAGAIGGVTGGIFGGAGAKISGGKRISEVEKEIAENLEDTVQGRGAKLDNLQNAIQKTGDDYEGSYVFLKDGLDIGDEYDSMGKIIGFNKDKQTATIEFIGKKDETGTITKDIDFGQAKLATEKEVKDSTENYIKENKKFLDKSDPNFKEFKKELGENGIDLDTPRFKRVTTPEFSDSINRAVIKAIDESPRLKARIDPRKRVTNQIADLVRDEEFASANPDIMNAFIREGIDPEDVATFIISESSIVGQKLGGKGLVAQDIQNKFIPMLQEATLKLTPEQRGLLDIIKEEKLIEERMAKKFNVGVDIWRSFLISQPATTMRNIIGSALRVPGQSIESSNFGFNKFFNKMDSEILGYETKVDNEYLNKSVFDLTKNLFNPEDAIPLARLVAKDFSKADKLLFQVFDDYMPIKRDELGFLGKSFSTASNYLNVLNRHQDRAIKSASFLSELDAQVKTAVNRGIIKEPGIDGIDQILKQNKLNLLNDEMVSKALDFAYKMTYQTKRAGDDLVIGGALVNNVQKSLNNNALLKTVIPFPNFLINSLVYTTNRSGLGALKGIKSGLKLSKRTKESALKNRADLNKAQTELEQLIKNKDAVDITRKAQLEDTIQKLSKDFAEAERDLVNLKRGMTETIEGAALLTAAVTLRYQLGGSEWYLIKDGTGQERDLRPIFPLAPFLFFADLIKKSFEDEPITQEYLIGGSEAVLGVTVRAGAIGNFARNGYQRLANMDNDPLAAKDLGKSIGSVLGYFLGGYATPTRPIQDLIQSVTGTETIERGMQKNAFGIDFEIDAPVFQGIVDEVAKNVFRGTPFEQAVFSDTPEFVSGTAEDTPRPVDAPIQKQFTGATVAPTKTRVGEELARLGIPEYKTNAGTRVPEYNYLFKQALGRVSTEIVEPFLNSPEYINSSPEEKRRKLDNMFFGKSTKNIPSRLVEAFTRRKVTYSNVRKLANAMVKAARPNLHYLANYRKSISSDDFSDAAEIYKKQNPGINLDKILSYIDEKKDREGSDNQKKILQDIASIATKRGSLGQQDFINLQRTARRLGLTRSTKNNDKGLKFQEGGAVNKNIYNQMDELGLAPEGTLVPRASTEVPVTTKDSKSVTEEEVLANLKTLSEIGVEMSPVGTYKAIRDFPENIKDSLNKYRKGQLGKAALQATLSTIDMIPGTPNISKSISKSTPPSKKISVDEVVADDATKIVESKEDVINFRDNPKQIAEWEKINKVSQKQKQVPKVAQAGRDLFEGKITSRKFRETVEKYNPIKKITTENFPNLPTKKDVAGALEKNKRQKLLNVDVDIPDGTVVGSRLDIPAYEAYDTWVVTLHDGGKGPAKAYGQVAVLKGGIKFESGADTTLGIARDRRRIKKGENVLLGKVTIGRMEGKFYNSNPEETYKKAYDIVANPDKYSEWTQVGFNPYRQSQFYNKDTGMPIFDADEVIQVGPLVLAKNVKKPTRQQLRSMKTKVGRLDPETGLDEKIDRSEKTGFRLFNAGGSINRQMEQLGL